jgi:hypothetical protein
MIYLDRATRDDVIDELEASDCPGGKNSVGSILSDLARQGMLRTVQQPKGLRYGPFPRKSYVLTAKGKARYSRVSGQARVHKSVARSMAAAETPRHPFQKDAPLKPRASMPVETASTGKLMEQKFRGLRTQLQMSMNAHQVRPLAPGSFPW